MSSILGKLQVLIGANTSQFHTALTGVDKKLDSTAAKAGAAGGVITGGLLMIGGAAVKSAIDIDQANAAIIRGTGASGAALKSLQNDFDAVFGTVPDGPDKIATAIADLNTRLEITGPTLQNFSKQYLLLTKMSKEDLSETIAHQTRMFNDWGISIGDQSGKLDQMWRASQQTGISVNELAKSMMEYGVPLRQLGFSFDESMMMMASWNKEGVNQKAILGSLKIALGRFAQEGVDASEAWKQAQEDIKSSTTDAQAAQIALNVVGSRALADYKGAVQEGRFEFEKYVNSIINGKNTIADSYNQSKTVAEELSEAYQDAAKSMEPIGKLLIPVLKETAGILGDIAGATADIVNFVDQLGRKKGESGNLGRAWNVTKLVGGAFAGAPGWGSAAPTPSQNKNIVTFNDLMAIAQAAVKGFTGEYKKLNEEVAETPKYATVWDEMTASLEEELKKQRGLYTDLVADTVSLVDNIQKTMNSGVSQDDAILLFMDDILAKSDRFTAMGMELPAAFAPWVEGAQNLKGYADDLTAVVAATQDYIDELSKLESDYSTFGATLEEAYQRGDISLEEYERRLASVDAWYQTQKRSIEAKDRALLDGLAAAQRLEEERVERLQREEETRLNLLQTAKDFINENATGLNLMAHIWENELNPELEKAQELYSAGLISIETYADGIENSITRALYVARGEFRSLNDFVESIARRQSMTMEAVWAEWARSLGMDIEQVKALFASAWDKASDGAETAADKSVRSWHRATRQIGSQFRNSFGGYGSIMGDIMNSWVKYYELSQKQMQYAGQNSAEAVQKYNEIAAQKTALVWATVGQALNNIAAKWEHGSSMMGDISSLAGAGLGAYVGGAAGAQVGAGVGRVAGGVMDWLFGGPSNEQLWADQGSQAGRIFGSAWSEAANQTMLQVAQNISLAKSGKLDMLSAMYHPDTLQQVMAKLTEFGHDVQDYWVSIFEDDTRSVLQNSLGLSEAQAAEAMAPLFDTAIKLAIENGETISDEMLRMINWGLSQGIELEMDESAFASTLENLLSRNTINMDQVNALLAVAEQLGYEFEDLDSIFTSALDSLITRSAISVENLTALKETAESMGYDIETALAEALDDFIESEDFAIEKLAAIAQAAAAAGYDVASSLNNALALARAELADLQAEAADIGANMVSWWLKKLQMARQQKEFKENYIDRKANDDLDEWRKNNKERLDNMTAEERQAAEQDYLQKQKNKHQKDFNRLAGIANKINIDGKHDLKDIREAIKDLSPEEQEIVLQLTQQRLERQAHRDQLKAMKKQNKTIKEQMKAQKDLIKAISQLTTTLDFSKHGEDATKFADELERAFAAVSGIANTSFNLDAAIQAATSANNNYSASTSVAVSSSGGAAPGRANNAQPSVLYLENPIYLDGRKIEEGSKQRVDTSIQTGGMKSIKPGARNLRRKF